MKAAILPENPKHYYRPEDGDEFVRIRDLTVEHKGRVFEARNALDGSGTVGYLADVTLWPLQHPAGHGAVQFIGQTQGYIGGLDAVLIMKPEGWTAPGLAPQRPDL